MSFSALALPLGSITHSDERAHAFLMRRPSPVDKRHQDDQHIDEAQSLENIPSGGGAFVPQRAAKASFFERFALPLRLFVSWRSVMG